VRGYQVAPAELEGHILEHPDVADCAVVPRTDPYSGEVPMAYVTLHADVRSRVKADAGEGERIKESVKKVTLAVLKKIDTSWLTRNFSTFLTTKFATNGLMVV
jgi:4-coumarate--CoA ligase